MYLKEEKKPVYNWFFLHVFSDNEKGSKWPCLQGELGVTKKSNMIYLKGM